MASPPAPDAGAERMARFWEAFKLEAAINRSRHGVERALKRQALRDRKPTPYEPGVTEACIKAHQEAQAQLNQPPERPNLKALVKAIEGTTRFGYRLRVWDSTAAIPLPLLTTWGKLPELRALYEGSELPGAHPTPRGWLDILPAIQGATKAQWLAVPGSASASRKDRTQPEPKAKRPAKPAEGDSCLTPQTPFF